MDRGEPVATGVGRRAAVLGHPVGHSLSPVIHGAAYAALGLDWTYEAIDVDEAELAGFLAGLGDEWAGLSLTMPLKVEAARLAHFIEPQAKLVGPVNTLVPSGKGEYRQWVGANTDIYGVAQALREAGASSPTTGVVVGGGATATSAIAALGALGVKAPSVLVRDRSRAGALVRAATRMGLSPDLVELASERAVDAVVRADAVVSTIPDDAGAELGQRLAARGQGVAGVLLDVVYSPPVTPLAVAWTAAGGRAIPGVRMLLHQAGEQVRLMTGQPAPLEQMDEALRQALIAR